MGKIGFLFEVHSHEIFQKRECFLNGVLLNNFFFVIFISTNKIDKEIILGVENFFHVDKCDFYFLDNNLNFQKYLVINDSSFKYVKYCVYEKKSIDFLNLTFWYDPKKYKQIRELLIINNLEGNIDNEIKNRVLKLIDFF